MWTPFTPIWFQEPAKPKSTQSQHDATKTSKGGIVRMIKYYIFCIRWLWQNREWANTRQKFRALERAWIKEAP